MLVKGHQSGRAENDILIKLIKIVFAEFELGAERKLLLAGLAHLFERAAVTGRDLAAVFQEHSDPRRIADTDANDSDAFIADRVDILRKGQ